MSSRSPALALALLTLFLPSLARSDWMVENNLDEPFTVTIWPQSQPNLIFKRRIDPGRQGLLKLGRDNHMIQLISGGGDVYTLKPTTLGNRGTTKLKTILTPDGRRNGRIDYEYMNQRGFDQNNNANSIRELGRSNWQTTFNLPDNNQMNARVEFRGGRGQYHTRVYTSELLNLRFRPSQNGQVLIDGDWRRGELQGRLDFQIDANQQRLTGRWTQDGTQWHSWTGNRLQ